MKVFLEVMVEIVLPVVVLLLVVIGLACVGFHYTEKHSCYEYGQVTGKKVEYHFWTGCYIRSTNGRWFPKNQAIWMDAQ